DAVTQYSYDDSGNVIKTVRFAASYTTAEIPDEDALVAWSASGPVAGDSSNRVSRSYYSARGELRFSVDALGYVTRYDYDAEGRTVGTTRFATPIANVTDATSIAEVAAAATGESVVTSTTYDSVGRVSETRD